MTGKLDEWRAFGIPGAWSKAVLTWFAWLMLLGFVYWDSLAGMVSLWETSDTYAHGYVVPMIVAWLIWRARYRWVNFSPRPGPLAVVLMVPVVCAWMLGNMVSVNVVEHFALVALVVLSVPAVFGWEVARALAFPLLFLFFAVPVGDFMLPWLMDRTADFTVLALRLSGIPVYREGLQFVIPSGNWSVVEACSGIRYLIASLMVGCLFAYLSYNSLRKRWLFMLVALLVPLLANWVRAYLIVLIGHLSGNELATGVDHLIYGWVFFGVVILAMLFIGARWADPVEPTASVPAVTAPAAQPLHAARLWPVVVAVLLLLLPPAAWQVLDTTVSRRTPDVVPVVVTEPWRAHPDHASSWEPHFLNPAARWRGGFADISGHLVDLDISFYRQQSRDRKLVSSSNVLVTSDDKQWSRVDGGQYTATLDGQLLAVQTGTLRNGSVALTAEGQRLRVWRFYWVNNSYTASDVRAKLLGAWQLLQGQGDDAAIVALSTPLEETLPETERIAAADRVLADFLSAQAQPLRAALQATQKDR